MIYLHRNGKVALLLAPAVLVLALFFFYPLARIIARSLDVSGAALSVGEFQAGLDHYARTIGDPAFQVILRNTFVIAAEASVIALFIAYPIALLMTHLSKRAVGWLLLLVLLPFWSSILVRLYAFMQILGRRGMINEALMATGVRQEPLDLLFNQFAAVIGMVHYLLPFMILVLYSVMVGIDRGLITAARSLGATSWYSLRAVFWPLSIPGVYAGVLLTFVLGLGFFLTPALLGGAEQTTIAVYIRTRVAILDWGVASAMGVVLLAVTVALLLAFNRLFHIERLLTLGGSGQGGQGSGDRALPARLRVGLWTYTIAAMTFLVGPLLVVIASSISPTPFLAFPPSGVSLRWFEDIVQDTRWLDAIGNSFQVGLLTMLVSTAIGLTTAVALVRVVRRGRSFLRTLLLLPIIVPTILIAIGLFDVQSQLDIRGTTLGLVMGHTVLAFPIATLVISSALYGTDPELENAAVTLGASRVRAFLTITLRLAAPGVVVAAVLAFITSWDEVVIALFLVRGTETTLPPVMFSFLESDIRPTVAAIGTILILSLVVLRVVAPSLPRILVGERR